MRLGTEIGPIRGIEAFCRFGCRASFVCGFGRREHIAVWSIGGILPEWKMLEGVSLFWGGESGQDRPPNKQMIAAVGQVVNLVVNLRGGW
jgi:hypothetical protein